jgi:hypothetical protein
MRSATRHHRNAEAVELSKDALNAPRFRKAGWRGHLSVHTPIDSSQVREDYRSSQTECLLCFMASQVLGQAALVKQGARRCQRTGWYLEMYCCLTG